ncbi:hypothetical protein EJB05_13154, partial [Eragrostis curvula]
LLCCIIDTLLCSSKSSILSPKYSARSHGNIPGTQCHHELSQNDLFKFQLVDLLFRNTWLLELLILFVGNSDLVTFLRIDDVVEKWYEDMKTKSKIPLSSII